MPDKKTHRMKDCKLRNIRDAFKARFFIFHSSCDHCGQIWCQVHSSSVWRRESRCCLEAAEANSNWIIFTKIRYCKDIITYFYINLNFSINKPIRGEGGISAMPEVWTEKRVILRELFYPRCYVITDGPRPMKMLRKEWSAASRLDLGVFPLFSHVSIKPDLMASSRSICGSSLFVKPRYSSSVRSGIIHSKKPS